MKINLIKEGNFIAIPNAVFKNKFKICPHNIHKITIVSKLVFGDAYSGCFDPDVVDYSVSMCVDVDFVYLDFSNIVFEDGLKIADHEGSISFPFIIEHSRKTFHGHNHPDYKTKTQNSFIVNFNIDDSIIYVKDTPFIQLDDYGNFYTVDLDEVIEEFEDDFTDAYGDSIVDSAYQDIYDEAIDQCAEAIGKAAIKTVEDDIYQEGYDFGWQSATEEMEDTIRNEIQTDFDDMQHDREKELEKRFIAKYEA